jgi:hypothetical protein
VRLICEDVIDLFRENKREQKQQEQKREGKNNSLIPMGRVAVKCPKVLFYGCSGEARQP